MLKFVWLALLGFGVQGLGLSSALGVRASRERVSGLR